MKKILLPFLALLTFGCYESPERQCKDFKTGRFQCEQTIDGKKTVITFERSDSLETSHFNGQTETATVRWVNDCEYVLRKQNPRNYKEAVAIDVKILTTSKNSYTFEFGEVGKPRRLTATATRVP